MLEIKSRTIAITGATGFAGRHVITELLAQGHTIRALVRDPALAKMPEAVVVVSGDLHSEMALTRLLDGADAVVHLAGVLAAVRDHDYFRVNAHGTLALAEVAIRLGIKRFVHVASLAARQPQLSAYAASKRAGEDAIAALADKLNAIIIRPSAVYGPGDRGTLPLIKELTQRIAFIPGRRDARFSLIHAGDLARLIVSSVSSDQGGLHEVSDGTIGGYGWSNLIAVAETLHGASIKPVFLPYGVPTAVAIAAETVARLTGKPGMVNRGKVRELYHRDWVCRTGLLTVDDPITFAAGFPETVAWYRKAGWLPQDSSGDRTGATA